MTNRFLEGKSYNQVIFENIVEENRTLSNLDLTQCVFKHCIFLDIIFVKCRFDECTFDHCTLSTIKFSECFVTTVNGSKSKLMGIDWSVINTLGLEIRLRDCNLSFSNFSGLSLIQSELVNCNVEGVGFINTKLNKSNLEGSDFRNATFDGTDLSEASLLKAKNYNIDPSKNKVHKLKAELPEAQSFLNAIGIIIQDNV